MPKIKAVIKSAIKLSLVLAVAATFTFSNSRSYAASGSPGVPEDPVSVYSEGFEGNPSASPILLTNYTGTNGETYSANPSWLNNCNGEVLFFNMNNSEFGNSNCDSNSSATGGAFNTVRRMAYALGTIRAGADPTTNRALTAYTDSGAGAVNPGANLVQLESLSDIALPGRIFVLTQLDVAAVSCGFNQPKLVFYLIEGGNSEQINQDPINPCTDPSAITVTPPPLSGNGAAFPSTGSIQVVSVPATSTYLSQSSSSKLRLVNQQGSGFGNDSAIDNVQILDASPKIDQEFGAATVPVGSTTTLTFTITNTTDLLAKEGWSFSNLLPSGIILADNPNIQTNCPNGNISVVPGGTTLNISGDLSAQMTSCTFSVSVTSSSSGTYTASASNSSDLVGLHLPGSASVTFTANTPASGGSQPQGGSTINQESSGNLAKTGEPQSHSLMAIAALFIFASVTFAYRKFNHRLS